MIRNAIIYQPAVVQPVGDPVGLVDEDVWYNAREPHRPDLHARTATPSRSSPTTSSPRAPAPPTGDNVDAGDGQGAVERRPGPAGGVPRGVRRRAARGAPATTTCCCSATSTPTPRRTRSRRCATPASSTSASVLDAGRYSYVFDDMSGSLDHALATPSADREGHRPDALEHQRGRVLRLPVRRRPGPVRAQPVPLQRPRPAGARHRPGGALPGPASRPSSGPSGDDVLVGTNGPT